MLLDLTYRVSQAISPIECLYCVATKAGVLPPLIFGGLLGEGLRQGHKETGDLQLGLLRFRCRLGSVGVEENFFPPRQGTLAFSCRWCGRLLF